MFEVRHWCVLLALSSGLWGCSAPNPNVRVERLQNGLL
jgi:hypothetical protein